MENVQCSYCATEYEIRWSHQDKRMKLSSSLFCPKCGTNVYNTGDNPRRYYLYEILGNDDALKGKKKKIPKYKLGPLCCCDKHMVVREGSFGRFWACLDYPTGCGMIKKFRYRKTA
ncbi:hypothetical protein [Leptospira sp. id769339]|uniref:hypothetical protein n=1 Tax=Leptospira sp. id769339 TaxID=2864221 RepID=UPI00214C7EE9|nr:hypothetical protein [Leptospira sp. id769339]MCR1795586.1 hypothetical protein [Leptospira sp. id769339]